MSWFEKSIPVYEPAWLTEGVELTELKTIVGNALDFSDISDEVDELVPDKEVSNGSASSSTSTTE